MATLRQTFSDIADAIRAKGVSGTMKPIEMASKIGEIKTGGGGQDYGYLTFTAEEATTLTLKQNESIAPHKLLKSTDGVNWVKWENPSTNGISLSVGQSVYLKADEDALTRTGTSNSYYNYFSSTGKINCSGDIRSLLNKVVAPGDYMYWFSNLFYNCTSLTQAPELPAKNLATSCYYRMFNGCTSLTQAPELPATTLATDCYDGMFSNCTSLTTAPELPATNLADYCYYQMFWNCTSLTKVPSVLPATTLANNCYNSMFYGCASLTTAPKLPATNLVDYCYSNMFNGCTSLTTAPELPATNLTSYCYQSMFRGCTSLTSAPELPATTLASNCYNSMFYGCTSLTTAPELHATTLANNCCQNMFYNCTSLTQAPELPATTLARSCYINMFNGCTSLKRIKMNASYKSWGTNMFNGCTSLELVDMTGSTGVPTLSNVNNFSNTNETYKIVVPDSIYDKWIVATNWASIASHIMKQSDWNASHPDDILG